MAIPVPAVPDPGRFFERNVRFHGPLLRRGVVQLLGVCQSIHPYITVSIIMLSADDHSKWEQMSKDEDGRKKLQIYKIRYGDFGLIQAFGRRWRFEPVVPWFTSAWVAAEAILSLVAGTAFPMWLGDFITERGIVTDLPVHLRRHHVSRSQRNLRSMPQSRASRLVQCLGASDDVCGYHFLVV